MVRHFALQKISLLRERGRPCLLRGHWLENWNVTGYSFGLHCLRPICRVFFSVMAVSFVSHRGQQLSCSHDDVIKCKHFPRYWPFVQGIPGHQWIPRTKGQRRRALMFYLFCAWINGGINNREAGDLRCHRTHHGVTVMSGNCVKEEGGRD